MIDTGVLFASHGMSGKEAVDYIVAEDVACACHDLGLGASDIGDESIGGNQRPDALNEIDDVADGSGEHDKIAAANSFFRTRKRVVDSTEIARAHERILAVRANNTASETCF